VSEPADLSVRILQEIREDIRGVRDDLRKSTEEQSRASRDANVRFEVIETALRDLAQQLVILGRGVKVAIESRGRGDDVLAEHERRIADPERRASGA